MTFKLSGSFQNTLINRISFESDAREQANVEGKSSLGQSRATSLVARKSNTTSTQIIKTIVQQQQPVYKISFFADPT